MAEWTERTVIEFKTGFFPLVCREGLKISIPTALSAARSAQPWPSPSPPHPPCLLAEDGSFNNHPTAQRQLLPTASSIPCATNNASIVQPTSNKLYALCSMQKRLTLSEITLINMKLQ